MARMVGIDSSTKKTGLSLFVDGELKDYCLVDYSKVKDINDRINQMGLGVLSVLGDWLPDMIYIEEPKGEGRNVELVHKLSEILGIVRCWAITHGCYYEEVKPSVWRHDLGIEQGKKKREELKAASISYVKDKYGIIPETDDVADSICVGAAMVEKYGGKGK